MFNSPQDDQNSKQNQESSPFFSMDQPVFAQDKAFEAKPATENVWDCHPCSVLSL